jgi:2Fe-2S ferredoxin
MTTLNFVLKDSTARTVEIVPGHSVMETAIKNNIRGIDAECGGSCSCATCHVYVDEADLALLPPADDFELEMLDGVAASRKYNSRLSCQLRPPASMASLTVVVPDRQS